MINYDKERINQIYQEEQSKTETAKLYAQEIGVEYNDNFRKRVGERINKVDSDAETVENFSQTITPGYEATVAMPSAWDTTSQSFLNIEQYCDKYNLDKGAVKSYKLISHNSSNLAYNIVFYTPEESTVIDLQKDLEELISKHINPIPAQALPPLNEDWFDRLVYTDVHIAMDVQGKSGDPLYDGKWDKEEVIKRLNKMITHTLQFQKSRTLIVDCLGDFLDGMGGETTRKGHELPQNMNDKEAFDLALEFKIQLVDSLINNYDVIICNNITNDNHSGVFAYFVSNAVKGILEAKYPDKVKVNTIKRFIDHYSFGNHTFVITHGKDIGETRYGMKPKLDAVQSEKLDQYCKNHNLYDGKFIEVSKGDSHQAIYDDTTSNDFQYYNYPAFSPPSNWVKTNFKLSKSGFRFYNIHAEENIKIAIPYFF